MDHQPEPGTTRTEPESVRLEAVVARVSTPELHGPGTKTVRLDGAELTGSVERSDEETPQLASELAGRLLDVHLDRTIGLGLAVATTAGLAALAWNASVQSALAAGLLVVALMTVWILGGRVTFSIGQGVVGYRSDMGWPRGVQEDDDVRWDWRPHKAETDDSPDPTG